MDSISKISGVLLACILLFLAPVFLMAQKAEIITESYVLTKTAYLLEHIRSNGYLSPEMYEEYQRQLGQTGLLYTVEMEHQKNVYYMDDLEKQGEGFEEEAPYKKQYVSFYEDDILNTLFEKREKYRMNQGDFFFLKVQSKSKSLAERMRTRIFVSEQNRAVQVQLGGVIRDEAS